MAARGRQRSTVGPVDGNPRGRVHSSDEEENTLTANEGFDTDIEIHATASGDKVNTQLHKTRSVTRKEAGVS